MRRLILLPVVIALLSLIAIPAFGEISETTDPVGFRTVLCLANSDTFVSIPFIRPAEYVGAITSAAGNTITVSGSPWTTNQFVYAVSASNFRADVVVNGAINASDVGLVKSKSGTALP